MTNPNDMAYPAAGVQNYEESNQVGGLTKLEMFSAMILQGFCSFPVDPDKDYLMGSPIKHRAEIAVSQAKALIEALNKEGK